MTDPRSALCRSLIIGPGRYGGSLDWPLVTRELEGRLETLNRQNHLPHLQSTINNIITALDYANEQNLAAITSKQPLPKGDR